MNAFKRDLQRHTRHAYHQARQQRATKRYEQGDFDDMRRTAVADAYHRRNRRGLGWVL